MPHTVGTGVGRTPPATTRCLDVTGSGGDQSPLATTVRLQVQRSELIDATTTVGSLLTGSAVPSAIAYSCCPPRQVRTVATGSVRTKLVRVCLAGCRCDAHSLVTSVTAARAEDWSTMAWLVV